VVLQADKGHATVILGKQDFL